MHTRCGKRGELHCGQLPTKGFLIDFIHAEIYKDNDPTKGENTWVREWKLPSEPWTFLVGSDGTIKSRFEGTVSANELDAAVKRLS